MRMEGAHSRCTIKVAVITAKMEGVMCGGFRGQAGLGVALLSPILGWVWPLEGCTVPGSILAGQAGFRREIRAGGMMGITYPCSMSRWHLDGGGDGRFVPVQSLFSENHRLKQTAPTGKGDGC